MYYMLSVWHAVNAGTSHNVLVSVLLPISCTDTAAVPLYNKQTNEPSPSIVEAYSFIYLNFYGKPKKANNSEFQSWFISSIAKKLSNTATVNGFFSGRLQVILCGGAINSPQLLMLSGIGPSDDLRRHNIEVLNHSPGVGRNLQDHIQLQIQYRCTQPVTFNSSQVMHYSGR